MFLNLPFFMDTRVRFISPNFHIYSQDPLTPTNLKPNVTPLNNILININFMKSTVGLKVYYIDYLCKILDKFKII
jgi:hypothetical protein